MHKIRVRTPALLLMVLLAAAVQICFGAEVQEPPAPKTAPATDLPVSALVDQLFKQIETDKPELMWEAVNRLVRLSSSNGNAVTDRLEKQLRSKDEKIRLACARALCQLNSIDDAAPVLCELVKTGNSAEIRRMAAGSLGLTLSLNGNEPVATALAAALNTETDSMARITIARSLWFVGSRNEGREALLQILAQAPEKQIKDEAALVLAENGAHRVHEVRLRLTSLYTEPTPQGERARNALRNAEEEGHANRENNKLAQGEQLLRELLLTVKRAYPDESKWDLDKLFEDAAKGMIGGLDPFSQYMDRDDVKSTQELLAQDYGGIGAYVGLRNGNFVVISPIYGSPADAAGMRALDTIQEVDGVKSSDLMDKGGLNSMIGRLKGKPGTPVRVKYMRRGFTRPIEITIMRENIRVESVYSAMLPGQIAYIRLTRFGERSVDEMQKAIKTLVKDGQAKGMVFDMRDNPGGLLRAGVDIADIFLQSGKLIVYSEGNKEFAPRKDFRSTGGPEDEAFPMVCLVGVGSASASEIVAGAFQDHKRAVLIGEKTYGKGSVQQIMPVKATERQTQLRLTVAKYYLPSGRCIHEKGVEVDIEIKPPETHSWIVENIYDLRKQMVFDDYVRSHWETNKESFMKLAVCDEFKCELWPDFETFYSGLKTRLDKSDIRAEVRTAARRRTQDEQKKEMVYDLETDMVLQRGVLELLNKLKIDPASIADYKALPEKFKKKDDTQDAMLPGEALKN